MRVLTFLSLLMMSLVATSFSETAEAGRRRIVTIKDKNGKSVNFDYEEGTRAQLEKTRPSVLEYQGNQLRANLAKQCMKNGPVGLRFAMDFAPEALAFNMAVGLSASDQAKEDPAYARHFVEQSFIDPMASVSFAGFMVGNRAMSSLLSMTGIAYDPCRILKRNAELIALPKMTGLQKVFKPFVGPIGMAAGLMFSNSLHEALTDPNIKICAAKMIGKVPAKDPRALKACEDAYEEWILGANIKARNLVPEMISMTLVVWTQAGATKVAQTVGGAITSKVATQIGKTSLWNMGAGLSYYGGGALAELGNNIIYKFAVIPGGETFALTAGRVAMFFGRLMPVSKLLMVFGSSMVFLELSNLYEPYVDKFITHPLQTRWKGQDIAGNLQMLTSQLDRMSKNNWVYSQPPRRTDCVSMPTSYGFSVMSYGCGSNEDAETPWKAITTYGNQSKDWREFLMSKTQAAIGNWQDYVLKFANTYSDAERFYTKITRRLRDKVYGKNYRFPNKLNLYDAAPLWGVPVDDNLWISRKICDLPDETKKRFRAVTQLLDVQIAQENKPFIDWKWHIGLSSWGLPTIIQYDPKNSSFKLGKQAKYDLNGLWEMRNGFAAMDCGQPMTYHLSEAPKDPKMSKDEKIERVRWARFDKAVDRLYWTLQGKHELGAHSDHRIPLDSDEYKEGASYNIYMMINLVLGAPARYSGGIAYLKRLNFDNDTIKPEYKTQKPLTLREIDTVDMSAYLLASMVCGPEAAKSIVKRSVPVLGGWDAQFLPPRVINPINFDPCSGQNISQKYMVDSPESPYFTAAMPHIDPYLSQWKANGITYVGLLDILKRHVNRQIIGMNATDNGFQRWWEAAVQGQVMTAAKSFRAQYAREVIAKQFWPAFTNGEYSKARNLGIAGNRGQAFGIANSVRDSAKDNFELLNRFLMPIVSKENVQKVKDLEADINQRLEISLLMTGPKNWFQGGLAKFKEKYPNQAPVQYDAYGDPVPVDRKKFPAEAPINSPLEDIAIQRFKDNQKGLNDSLKELAKVLKTTIDPRPGHDNLARMANALLGNLKALVTEVDTYHGFVVSVRPDAQP